MTTPRVELFDTSLRDGMQQPNLEISVPAAVSLLERMGAFGVHYAEIGFAGANHFVTQLCAALENSRTGAMKLALFGRTRGRGMRVQDWSDSPALNPSTSLTLKASSPGTISATTCCGRKVR